MKLDVDPVVVAGIAVAHPGADTLVLVFSQAVYGDHPPFADVGPLVYCGEHACDVTAHEG